MLIARAGEEIVCPKGIEDFTGHPIELHVLEVLLGVVPPAVHVFKAPLGRDGFRRLEPRAGVRDEPDPGEDLIRLDHDMVAAVDPLDPKALSDKRRAGRSRLPDHLPWVEIVIPPEDTAAPVRSPEAPSKPAGGRRTPPTLGDKVFALANGKTQQRSPLHKKGLTLTMPVWLLPGTNGLVAANITSVA